MCSAVSPNKQLLPGYLNCELTMPRPTRTSVDLSGYPNLVVIYLGYRVSSLHGLKRLRRIGHGLRALKSDPPAGLLLHENIMFGLLHPGFRQYWRDLESLEAFTRAPFHAALWKDFTTDSAGSGIWHESYCLRGGMEGIYLNAPDLGFGKFAQWRDPVGPARTARARLGPMPGVLPG